MREFSETSHIISLKLCGKQPHVGHIGTAKKTKARRIVLVRPDFRPFRRILKGKLGTCYAGVSVDGSLPVGLIEAGDALGWTLYYKMTEMWERSRHLDSN